MANSNGSITLDWADSTYHFRLGWSEIIELQNKIDAGPGFILDSFWNNTWKVQYISEIIRLGLIGGGKTPSEALNLVRTYVEARPPLENLSVAQAILALSMTGDDEDSGENQPVPEKKE